MNPHPVIYEQAQTLLAERNLQVFFKLPLSRAVSNKKLCNILEETKAANPPPQQQQQQRTQFQKYSE